MGSTPDTLTDTSLLQREVDPGAPTTTYDSKMVMLRAERHDTLHISDVRTRLRSGTDIPSEVVVVQRKSPYFGPSLILESGGHPYRLTAPGPDTQLLMWTGNLIDDGDQYGWHKLAEVTAAFADDQPQYDLCPECGQPMQTIEHERKAAIGRCPGPSN